MGTKFILITLLSINLYKSEEIIDVSKTIIIQGPHRNVHFGFSVHLQQGKTANSNHHVIVGAPKRRNIYGKLTGTVYRCTVEPGGFCQEYDLKRTNDVNYPPGNGELLGSKIVGESDYGGQFFTCAPRLMSVYDRKNYFMKGACYQMKNSTDVRGKATVIAPSQGLKVTNNGDTFRTYYESAFAQVGFDIHYVKDSSELMVTGAPGMTDWSGTLFSTNLSKINDKSESLPRRSSPIENYSYFGYSVSVGKFLNDSKEIWFVAGIPRASKLKGQVVLFELFPSSSEKIRVKEKFFGNEMGSYFGYSILVLPGNAGDSIIVSAPMSRGNSWDEGAVYHYKNLGNSNGFATPIKFTGTSEGSRFGTTMANLGNLRLDLSNCNFSNLNTKYKYSVNIRYSVVDVAVSAPYENNGNGAVYLYADEGGDGNYNFLSKLTSSRDGIRGFGMSISNSLDLDGNLHKDFAVGTYGSDCVVILHTLTAFDMVFQVNQSGGDETLNTTLKNFTLNYSVTLSSRNQIPSVQNVSLKLTFEDDDRIIKKRMMNNRTISMLTDSKYNFSHTVELKSAFTNFSPLKITLLGKILDGRSEEFSKQFQLPFAPECGHDGVCNTDLSLATTLTEKNRIIVGLTRQLEVSVTVTNKGEPAFRVHILYILPVEVTITNVNECEIINSTIYRCLLSERLISLRQTSFRMNVAEIGPNIKKLKVKIKVESSGVENNQSDNEIVLEIPVITESKVFIDSKSTPEMVTHLDESGVLRTEISFIHTFNVINGGPSPLNLNLRLSIPKITSSDGGDLFQIVSVEGAVSDISTACEMTSGGEEGNNLNPEMLNLSNKENNLLKIIPDDNDTTLQITCFQGLDSCVQFLCSGGYFKKSSESATFTIVINANTQRIREKFQNVSAEIETLAFVTYAILNYGDDDGEYKILYNRSTTTTSTAVTVMHGLLRQHVNALWICILSTISGVSLLGLLMLIMYKCNFFKRTYKDRMKLNLQEQLIPPKEPSDYEVMIDAQSVRLDVK